MLQFMWPWLIPCLGETCGNFQLPIYRLHTTEQNNCGLIHTLLSLQMFWDMLDKRTAPRKALMLPAMVCAHLVLHDIVKVKGEIKVQLQDCEG